MKRWATSFRFATEGLLYVVRMERNMRLHAGASAIAVAAGLISGLSRWEWLWVALAIAAVWSAECVNTAIERAVDLAADGKPHPLAKAAKDASAAAVLIAAVFSLVVAGFVLLPALVQLF